MTGRAAALSACALAALLAACRPGDPIPRSAGLPTVSPSDVGLDSGRLDRVVEYLRTQVDSGAFPGAVVAVGRHGRLALLAAVGRYGDDDRRRPDPGTIYDLASLTKVVGLTTAVMLLVAEGSLELDQPVARWVPPFRGAGKDSVTLRHLLTHTSGLPAWRPLYTEAPTRAAALLLTDTTPLVRPPGLAAVYSDLGAIILTQAVETAAGTPLDSFLARRVFQPLEMSATRFRPPPGWQNRIAPTERAPWRGAVIRGSVHDENAWRLGGVSGHAGMFSNALDLSRFTAWLLDQWHGRPLADTAALEPWSEDAPRLPADLVREFTRRQDVVAGSSRALGWDTPSEGSSAGTGLSAAAFGHTGFTGTSVWIDPGQDLFIILLTNRVHPTRENPRILRVRPRVANLVVDALTGAIP